jgi:hypothetical protein
MLRNFIDPLTFGLAAILALAILAFSTQRHPPAPTESNAIALQAYSDFKSFRN